MDKPKFFWNTILFITISLYLTALFKDLIWLYPCVIVLSFIIYRNGQKYLFKEYDEKRRQKREFMGKMLNNKKE